MRFALTLRKTAAAAVVAAAPLGLAAAPTAVQAGVTQAGAGSLVRLRAIDTMTDAGTSGWAGDDAFAGGDRATLDQVDTTGIADAAPASVYQTSRVGKKITYTLRDLHPGATYVVRTHSIEDYFAAKGQRVMNVTANGTAVVTGLDLVAAAGPRKPVVRQFTVTADAAGIVRLAFVGVKADATVAGIEVLRTGTATAPATPTDVKATAIATNAVEVDWKGDIEASKYTVYRDGRRIATTSDPAYLDQAVAPGESHTYTVTATGPTFRVSASTPAAKVSVPTSTLKTGRYATNDGVITDPSGKPFVAVGANLGTPSTASGKGIANGHAVQAKAWGWNAVRLTFYASDQYSWTYRAQFGYPALLDQARKVIDEYRAQGIVVLVDGHDIPEDSANPAKVIDQMDGFWKDMATTYKADSGVWFNLINEPQAVNDDWYALNARFLATIRATGNQSIAVADVPVWGQDLGSLPQWFKGARNASDATMGPKLAARYGNVVLSQHNYGAYSVYTNPTAYTTYAKSVQRAGLPLVTGETGYTVDGSTTAGSYTLNRDATIATFAVNRGNKVGTFVWNATHSDQYSVKADGSAFFTGANPLDGASDMGKRLWTLAH